MKCRLVEQGFKAGSCLTRRKKENAKACDITLKQEGHQWFRLIKSAHLSRPEHYFSIYQSGCNHSCLKCHSWDFTQEANGSWISAAEIGRMAKEYERSVTVRELREKATMWHATDLCHSCGSCLITGERGWLCPQVLEPKDIILSPQGLGPARNIIAFTGGDLVCCVDFTCQAAEHIKAHCEKMWVLIETNGFGLTPLNLDRLKDSGVDSFWLDIKAFDDAIYRRLCGTSNASLLQTPAEISQRGFVLEVLTLFIPGWVEDDEICKIAKLLFALNPEIPLTILAFFPAYQMKNVPPPTLSDMVRVFGRVKEMGLKNVKLGNCGVFAKSRQDWQDLLAQIGKRGIG